MELRVIFKEIYYTFTKNFIEQNFFPLKSYKKMSKGRPRRTIILFELFKIEIRANWRFFLSFWLRLSSRAVLAVRPTLQMIAGSSTGRDRGYLVDQSEDSAPILAFLWFANRQRRHLGLLWLVAKDLIGQ